MSTYERVVDVPGGWRHEYKIHWCRPTLALSWRLASHCASLPCFLPAIRRWNACSQPARTATLPGSPALLTVADHWSFRLSAQEDPPLAASPQANVPCTRPTMVEILGAGERPPSRERPAIDACDIPLEHSSEASDSVTPSPVSSDTEPECCPAGTAADGPITAPRSGIWIPLKILREGWVHKQRQYQVRWLGLEKPLWGHATAYDRQRVFRSVVAAWRKRHPLPPKRSAPCHGGPGGQDQSQTRGHIRSQPRPGPGPKLEPEPEPAEARTRTEVEARAKARPEAGPGTKARPRARARFSARIRAKARDNPSASARVRAKTRTRNKARPSQTHNNNQSHSQSRAKAKITVRDKARTKPTPMPKP